MSQLQCQQIQLALNYVRLRKISVHNCDSEFKFRGEVYSDGTAAMTGKHSGVIPQTKELTQNINSMHCFLYQKQKQTDKQIKV